MKKVLFTLCCLLAAAVSYAQPRYVVINTGTTVTNSGVEVVLSGGYGAVATPGEFRNSGSYIDTTGAGYLSLKGPYWFSRTGTTMLSNFTAVNYLNYSEYKVSVYDSVIVNAGDTTDFNDGASDTGMILRTDIPGHTHA